MTTDEKYKNRLKKLEKLDQYEKDFNGKWKGLYFFNKPPFTLYGIRIFDSYEDAETGINQLMNEWRNKQNSESIIMKIQGIDRHGQENSNKFNDLRSWIIIPDSSKA